MNYCASLTSLQYVFPCETVEENKSVFVPLSVKDGIFRVYRGSRDANELVSYIDDKKWESEEPLPWYKSPNSFQ